MEQNQEDLIQERDAALRSLDREQILAYMVKYGVAVPEDEHVFWAAVHMSRCGNTNLTDEERMASAHWLQDRGLGRIVQ